MHPGVAACAAAKQVLSWKAEGSDGGVSVMTDRGTYKADKLILAAGAWMDQLVPELQVCVGGDSSKAVWSRSSMEACADWGFELRSGLPTSVNNRVQGCALHIHVHIQRAAPRPAATKEQLHCAGAGDGGGAIEPRSCTCARCRAGPCHARQGHGWLVWGAASPARPLHSWSAAGVHGARWRPDVLWVPRVWVPARWVELVACGFTIGGLLCRRVVEAACGMRPIQSHCNQQVQCGDAARLPGKHPHAPAGLKAGVMVHGQQTRQDPDQQDRGMRQEEEAVLRSYLQRYMPGGREAAVAGLVGCSQGLPAPSLPVKWQ